MVNLPPLARTRRAPHPLARPLAALALLLTTAGATLAQTPATFALQANSPATGGSDSYNVAVADVNGDGKPDALVVNNSGTLGVLLGNGSGGASRCNPTRLTWALIVPLTCPWPT